MRSLAVTLALASVSTLAPAPAPACDADDRDGTAFILREDRGTTRMIGSLHDLKDLKRKLAGHSLPAMWTRIDGHEYVIDDPAVVGRARAIFMRSAPMDAEQDALERDMEALQRRQEDLDAREDAASDAGRVERDTELRARLEAEERALDRRQDELDGVQDRASDQQLRELEALAREAIRTGTAR